MSGIIYAPCIWLKGQDFEEDIQLPINIELRLYLESPAHQVHEDDTSIYTLDIEEQTLAELDKLVESDDEKALITRIRETGAEWIDIEPHSYFVAD